MKEQILGRRYAKALFAIAQERNVLDKIRSELHSFAAALEENAEFGDFFRSPENSRAAKHAAVEKIFRTAFPISFFNSCCCSFKRPAQHHSRHRVGFDALYDRHRPHPRAGPLPPCRWTPRCRTISAIACRKA
jgi:hypothetical protein